MFALYPEEDCHFSRYAYLQENTSWKCRYIITLSYFWSSLRTLLSKDIWLTLIENLNKNNEYEAQAANDMSKFKIVDHSVT